MAKYEVIIPWYGVVKGQTVDFDELHPVLKPNVRLLSDEAAAALTPSIEQPKKPTKKEIIEKLTELGIEFDDKAKVDELIALLPEE
ncbi:Uncharacterised protein [Providencia rettgeri]|uniref:hypothetical protein n=1 Tax=Providencia rettgeri TaxID=587 RepID=UPI001EF45D0D|nr:hypothetical protein [Providencia rettgeri]CAB5566973.1 Uncharacterised protein [Providencia rettgeri]CAC9131973.1 Uncharacterised protein [Providencia rettgeri]